MATRKKAPAFDAAAFLTRLRADGWSFRLLAEVGSAKGYQIFYRSVPSYTPEQDEQIARQIKANRDAIIAQLMEEGRQRIAAQIAATQWLCRRENQEAA